MKLSGRICLCILAAWAITHAKNTFSSFSLAPAWPVTSTKARTPTGEKELGTGWDAGWTLFGKPFTRLDNPLKGLALGGRISYSRWLRDSTSTAVTFLGTQVIARYYIPRIVRPIDLFCQAGGGMFIGEYNFCSVDTTNWENKPRVPVIFEGQKDLGLSFGIGVNWEVVEIVPTITCVSTKDGWCGWFSLNAAMTF